MKKTKKAFICILAVVILGIILTIIYIKTDFLKTKEQLFWKYFLKEKDEIVNVLSNNEVKLYNEKIKKSSYIKEGNISIISEHNFLKPIYINIVEKGNKDKDYKNIQLDLKYDDKDINQTTIIKEDNYFFVKNEILNKDYIGFENDNLKQVAKKMGIANTEFIPNKIKDIDYDELFTISDEETRYILKKYVPICRKHVNNKHYIKEENVKLENERGKIVSYKVQVTEKQFNDMVIDVLKELHDDEKSLNIICNKVRIIDDTNIYCDINNVKYKIEEFIDVLEKKDVKDETFLSIIIYKNENDVVKTELVLNNDRTISIQTDKRNKIIIKQYDIMNNEINLKTFSEIIRTALNTISEVTYTKEIINEDKQKVELNIKCNLGIENVNINYNYVEQIKKNVDNIIRKDEIEYIDLNKTTEEFYKSLLEKVLKINALEDGKNY